MRYIVLSLFLLSCGARQVEITTNKHESLLKSREVKGSELDRGMVSSTNTTAHESGEHNASEGLTLSSVLNQVELNSFLKEDYTLDREYFENGSLRRETIKKQTDTGSSSKEKQLTEELSKLRTENTKLEQQLVQATTSQTTEKEVVNSIVEGESKSLDKSKEKRVDRESISIILVILITILAWELLRRFVVSKLKFGRYGF